MRKINDRFIVFFLGVSLPSFLFLILGILLWCAIIDRLSFDEAFEGIQFTLPLIITYVGAILGFSFNTNRGIGIMNISSAVPDDPKRIIRPLISLILTCGLMLFLLVITLALVFDWITFANFKRGTAMITWTLTGLVSFIIGKYFGEEIRVIQPNL